MSYDPCTAQKLMRAAEIWGPFLKSEPDSVTPKLSIVYEPSAPSVPASIRSTYVPRDIAGEDVRREFRLAIEARGEAVKGAAEQDACGAAKTPRANEATAKLVKATARRDAREAGRVQGERQQAARTAALALILARLGDDPPELLALEAEAGPGTVLALEMSLLRSKWICGRTHGARRRTHPPTLRPIWPRASRVPH